MLRVVPLRDRDHLAEYHLHWQALAGDTPGLGCWQSLAAWWSLCDAPANGEPLVLAVLNGDRPLGFVPLWLATESQRRVLRGGPWPEPLPWRCVGTQPTVVMLAAWRWLKQDFHDWDQLELPAIDVPGHDGGRALNTLRQVGYEPQIEWHTHGEVATDGEWLDFWYSRAHETRNAVRWAEHKLAERGKLSFLRYRPLGKQAGDDEPHHEWLDACAEFNAQGWLPQTSAARAVHQAAVNAGELDLSLLLLNDRPVAVAYGTLHDGRVTIVGRGVSRDFAELDLTGVLIARLLGDSFERADTSVDLGPLDDASREWAVSKSLRATYQVWRRPTWKLAVHLPAWWETWTRS
ncbi:MAG: GNAT family N-acetyltransferase [Planctomycetaceae bacterium]|nr:GNAT family N-acetyltransferase [Planctomycetaceae bacterium]